MTFKDKDKKEVSRVLSKVADVATFVDEIAHITTKVNLRM